MQLVHILSGLVSKLSKFLNQTIFPSLKIKFIFFQLPLFHLIVPTADINKSPNFG